MIKSVNILFIGNRENLPRRNVPFISPSKVNLSAQVRVILHNVNDIEEKEPPHNTSVISINSNPDESVEFVSESKATSESIQIARLNKKIANLKREIKKEKEEKKNEEKTTEQHQQNQTMFTQPSTSTQNNSQQDNTEANSSLPSLSDSFIQQTAEEWAKNPDQLAEFMQFIEGAD